MHIGENIRQLRETHNLSQADIGQIAGVSDRAVSTWELGKRIPRMGALECIASHFHLTISDLIEGGENSFQDAPRRNCTDCIVDKVVERLKQYEDTGLSPDDVARLKNERDTALTQLKECCFNGAEDSCRLYCSNEGDACKICQDGDSWKWGDSQEKA